MRPRDPNRLTAAEIGRTMRMAMVDGALFALMLGVAETSFLAEAVRLGAGPLAIALLTSLPLLCGGLGSLLMLRALRRVPRRRVWVVGCALGQVVVLTALTAFVALDRNGVAVLLVLLCVYHLFGQAAGTAWSSWYGDLVPRPVRGRYFAARTRVVHVATFVSVLGGGAVLAAMPPPGGFAVLFALAAGARLLSALLLARSAEPRFRGLGPPQRPIQFLTSGAGRNARTVLFGAALFHLGVYLAAPFFSPYMLEECGLDWDGYMLTLGAVVAVKALTLPLWGRLVDRIGSHRAFRLALLLSATIPIPFLWADELLGLTLAYGWSGLCWGGFEVAAFALVLDSTTRRTRPQVFAAQGLLNGGAQLGGSLAGAALMASGGYGLVFAGSFAARLVVALLLPWFVRPMAARQADRGAGMALRLIGFRPSGGMVHRPVFDESGNPGTPRLSAPPTADAAEPVDATPAEVH
ncbi:MAG: MFS transporter [Planctomycetota bacterium]